MKPPYENNRVYAIASTPRGLKTGYVSAVFAQVRYGDSNRVSDDPVHGRFFLVDPDEFKDFGGNADLWDPSVTKGLLALGEEESLVENVPHTHVLSTWSDREKAWAEFEGRRAAGRKGAQTRADRQAAELIAQQAEAAEASRQRREESPLGRLKASVRGLENAFVAPARNGQPARVLVSIVMTPEGFRKYAEKRGADPELVEEFLADDDPMSGF